MKPEIFIKQLSKYAQEREPFVFIIDFEFLKPVVCKLEDAKRKGIFYNIKGYSNLSPLKQKQKIELKYDPLDKRIFSRKFKNVINHINNGNSYLLNLTFPTQIDINLSLEDIFHTAKAPYKLLYKDNFVVFSPECFVKTENNTIYTYPMKGTIDASLDNAESILLNNKKEEWEHNTIVDLMRNDLSMVANNVTVSRYRYVEKIKTHKNEILQTSSEIKGILPKDWQQNIDNLFMKILPAGSISGAPKAKTLEIIKSQELGSRGYYTGIFGIFNGKDIECAVSIRYIERKKNKIFFRSGGGITAQSNLDEEYQELIQKIYVPTF